MSAHPSPSGGGTVPRTALRVEEAAASLGISADHFARHVAPHLSVVRLGRVRLIGLEELRRFVTAHAEREGQR